jgi:hypothetical protein
MAIFGQEKDVCVEIKAVDKIAVDETLQVTADLKVDFLTAPQKLHWKTSKGQKVTTEDFVAQFAITKEDAGKTLTISLEFEGLPDNCLKVYEKNVEVYIPADYGYERPTSNSISWSDEKNILNYKSIHLQEKNDTTFYIIIYTKTPNSKKLAQRKARIMNYLTKEQKIAKKRIIITVKKSTFEETEYWIVEKDAEKPY